MPYSCLIYVILLSYICHTHVLYMSYSCRIYVILMSYICHTYSCCLSWAVASRNNDRTVASKAFAWLLLGMMPSISKPATIVQTDEWLSERRTRLYHSCVDIVTQWGGTLKRLTASCTRCVRLSCGVGLKTLLVRALNMRISIWSRLWPTLPTIKMFSCAFCAIIAAVGWSSSMNRCWKTCLTIQNLAQLPWTRPK